MLNDLIFSLMAILSSSSKQGADSVVPASYASSKNATLQRTLTMPYNMTLTQSYEEKRDLLIGQLYKRSSTSVASRSYTYDTLGRPVTRNTSKDGATINDSFGYNSRSELNIATVNNEAYAYDYDNIGNRETAQEAAESATTYGSNRLNQYTAIGDFEPTYDDAGNQTKVKTSTGIWSVVYNAENRPISFINEATGTVVECTYDYMGRRATKKVTVNERVTLHHRFLYRGYLQIACCDLTRSNHPCLWLITWDPSQPVATRPLAIQKDGTWYTYGWDLTKNICEVYGQHGYIRSTYTYSPYGETSASGDVKQPILWSSEYHDTELGMMYYNYRHYNPKDGCWTVRDFVTERVAYNLYCFAKNGVIFLYDNLGLLEGGIGAIINGVHGLPHTTAHTSDNDDNIQFPIQGSVSLSINDFTNHITSGPIPLWIEIEKTGKIRCDYDILVKSLEDANLSKEEASLVRDKIRSEFQKKQTNLGKALTAQILKNEMQKATLKGELIRLKPTQL